jgi:Tfp pilus assembly protein PilF
MDSKWYLVLAVGVLIGRTLVVRSHGPRARKWCDKGIKALEQNAVAEAQHAFGKVVRLQPIWAPGRRLLARAHIMAGDFAAAEEHLRFASDLQPRSPDGHMDLGLFLAICPPKRPDQAVEAFIKAVELAPELKEILAAEPRLTHLRDHEGFRRLTGESG